MTQRTLRIRRIPDFMILPLLSGCGDVDQLAEDAQDQSVSPQSSGPKRDALSLRRFQDTEKKSATIT